MVDKTVDRVLALPLPPQPEPHLEGKTLVTLQWLAQALGVSVRTLHRWRKDPAVLPYYTVLDVNNRATRIVVALDEIRIPDCPAVLVKQDHVLQDPGIAPDDAPDDGRRPSPARAVFPPF